MAIERNDVNMLNNIQISASNNRTFYQDVRSVIFFTTEFAITPTYITSAQDVLDLKIENLVETHAFYKLIASAYSQSYTPLNVIVYGNTAATTFTQLITTYKNHESAFEVTNWVTNIDAKTKKDFIDSIVAYAKTDKEIQVGIALEVSKIGTIADVVKYQTNANQNNVMFIVEGSKNVAAGNWLTGAVFGGNIGYKSLGSYITHSLQITGFVQENFTSTEQQTMKDAGLNYLSKPTRGYYHLVNGLNSDNATFTELNLIRIWLVDGLRKDLTVLQVTRDKIPLNDTGRALLTAVINERIRQGADAGMFMTDSSGNYYGTITQTDSNGNELKIQLGSLTVGILTQESLREGLFNFTLALTYLNGVRNVTLTGTITTDGTLVVE